VIEEKIVELLGAKVKLGRFQDEFNGLFECIQDDLNKIPEYTLTILNQQISHKFEVVSIWQLEGEFVHLHCIFRSLYKILAYKIRKEKAHATLATLYFEKKNSLIDELKKGVIVMNYLSTILPMKKDVGENVAQALYLTNNFKQHRHYLLHLSYEKELYRIRDLLLYLRYFNRMYFEIYKLGVESVYRNIKYNAIQQNDEER
jgi:hypothetical protein